MTAGIDRTRTGATARARVGLGLAIALGLAAMSGVAALAGEPGTGDRVPVSSAVPVAVPVPVEPAAVARPLAPLPFEPAPVTAAPEPVSVTYAEAVGYFSRYGYEATKRDAQLYCAQVGRIAVLDVRFELNDEWYSRFDCVVPR